MLVTFSAGFILLVIAYGSYMMTRDMFHPAVVFSMVWGISITLLTFLPLLGYFSIEHEVLLLYILSGFVFSITALFTQWYFHGKMTNQNKNKLPFIKVKTRYLLYFIFIIHIVIIPQWYNDIMNATGGGSIYRISYMLRNLQTHGEKIHGILVANYFTLGLAVIPILTILYVQKQIRGFTYIIALMPWLMMSLVSNGRSSLIALLIALFVIYKLSGGKFTLRFYLIGLILFVTIFTGGAILTAKQGITEDSSLNETLQAVFMNFSDYTFQGPILFSRYYAGLIHVSEQWSPLNGVYTLLNKVGMANLPKINIKDYHYFSILNDGNVYTIFFSIYPKVGILGALLYTSLYSFITTLFYFIGKRGNLLFLVLYSYLFSAMVLSIFSDRFGPDLYFYIKVIFFIILITLLFRKKYVWNGKM